MRRRVKNGREESSKAKIKVEAEHATKPQIDSVRRRLKVAILAITPHKRRTLGDSSLRRILTNGRVFQSRIIDRPKR
jgi:hypothetical protein